MLLRKTELRASLVKPSVPEGRGKELQLRLALIETILTDTRGQSARDGLVYRGFPRFAGFSISDLSKSRKPTSSLPPSLAVPCRFFLHLLVLPTSSSASRNTSPPFQTNSPRFTLLPNRKSQLLRASPLVRALSLSSVSSVFFNCGQRSPI